MRKLITKETIASISRTNTHACSDTCPGALFVPRSEQFSEGEAQGDF